MSNRRKKNGRRKRRVKAIQARVRREEKARVAAQSKVYHLKTEIYSLYENSGLTLQADSAKELYKKFYWTKPSDFRKCVIDGQPCSPEYFFNYLEEQKVRAAIRELRYSIPQEIIDLRGIVDRGDHLIVNKPPGESAFRHMCAKLAGSEIITLFHGTPAHNVPSILQDNFKLSKWGALGRGLYLGPMTKAINFTGGNRWLGRPGSWKREQAERLSRDTVIECKVVLGRCNEPGRADIGHISPGSSGFDTLYYAGFSNPEYCVQSVNQVLIRRIILVPKRQGFV